MNALETAVDKLENVRIAIQSGKMPKHAGLFDLPSLDRADVIMAYISENPESFDDCLEDIESALLSDIAPPRTFFAEWVPSTHASASTTFDLPDPFGPTTPVMPGAKSNRVLSANDLNPTSSRRFSMASCQWPVAS